MYLPLHAGHTHSNTAGAVETIAVVVAVLLVMAVVTYTLTART